MIHKSNAEKNKKIITAEKLPSKTKGQDYLLLMYGISYFATKIMISVNIILLLTTHNFNYKLLFGKFHYYISNVKL